MDVGEDAALTALMDRTAARHGRIDVLHSHAGIQIEGSLEVVATRVPLGRFGRIDEIAEAILFLVSDRSSYITGHALVIDGGEHLVGAGPHV